MFGLVGCSCNPLTIYRPRVRVRVATVSKIAHLLYRYARIFSGLRRTDTRGIG